MRRKRTISFLIVCMLALLLAGCGDVEIKPDTPDGHYATQNRLSAIEYSIYINKQITVFVGQLSTRITAIRTDNDLAGSNEPELAKEGLSIMQDARDEVEVTYPSEGHDDDREAVLTAMNTAIADMQAYIDDLNAGKDVSNYDSVFRSDANELTGMAALYNE